MLNTLSLPKLNQPGSDPEGSPGPKNVSQDHITPKNKVILLHPNHQDHRNCLCDQEWNPLIS